MLDKNTKEKHMSDDVVPVATLVKVYRKIKAKVDLLTKEYDTQVEILKAQQDEVRFAIQEQLKAQGGTSMRTEFGTVTLKKSTRYNTNDWDSFKKFVIEHDVVDLLEKRIAQGNMIQFLDQNPGLVPPGLNSTSEFSITVTKPSK